MGTANLDYWFIGIGNLRSKYTKIHSGDYTFLWGSPGSTAGIIVCMYGHTYSKSMGQPGKVANPARGQPNRENGYFPLRART